MKSTPCTAWAALFVLVSACPSDDDRRGAPDADAHATDDTVGGGDADGAGDTTVIGDTSIPEAPPGTVVLLGRLVPPAGRAATDYEVVNAYGSTPVDSLGVFALPVTADGLTVTIATTRDDDDENLLFAITARHGKGTAVGADEQLLVSPLSTALGLVATDLLLTTHDPARVAETLRVAAALDAVLALASRISATFGAADDTIDDAFASDYVAAVGATLLALERQGYALPAGGPIGNREGTVRWHGTDFPRQLVMELADDQIEVSGLRLFPLGQVLRLAEIDPDGAYQITDDRAVGADRVTTTKLSNNQHFDGIRTNANCLPSQRHAFHHFTTLATGVEDGYLGGDPIGTYVDVVGKALDEVIGQVVDLVGLGSADASFTIDRSRPGLYELRAFTGRIGDGLDCGENAFVGATFAEERKTAFIANLTLLIIDLIPYAPAEMEHITEIIDIKAVIAACVVEVMTASDAYLPLDWNTPFSFQNAEALVRNVSSAALSCAKGAIDEVIGAGPSAAVGKVLKSTARLWRFVGRKSEQVQATVGPILETLSNIAVFAGPAERLLTLVGWLDQFHGQYTTPMDTYLIRVGDPFSPVITAIRVNGGPALSITEARGDAPLVASGDVVTLVGERFEPGTPETDYLLLKLVDASGWQALLRARVVSDTELELTVPEGLSDYVAIDLRSPGDGAYVANALVVDPQLRCQGPGEPAWSPCPAETAEISPRQLFIPDAAMPLAAGYTPELRLLARGVNVTTPDVVRLRGAAVNALRVDPAQSSPSELVVTLDPATLAGSYEVVLAPALASAAVTAKYGDGDLVGSDTRVQVLPAPLIDSTSPEQVGYGEIFTLRGWNFGADLAQVRVQLEVGTTNPIRQDLAVYRVGPWEGGAAGGAQVQPSLIVAKLQYALPAPWNPASNTVAVWVQTPAGEARHVITLGDDQGPLHARLVAVQQASGWAEALEFVQGIDQPGGTFSWDTVLRPNPNPEDPGDPLCIFDPPVGHWGYDLAEKFTFGSTTSDPLRPLLPPGATLPAVGVSWPPKRETAGGCGEHCSYFAPSPDFESYLDHPEFNPTNLVFGLPRDPCPSTWAGIGAGDVWDRLYNHLPGFDVTPATGAYEDIVANWLIVDLDVQTGGGLRFLGPSGARSHLSGRVGGVNPQQSFGIKIAEPRRSQPGVPIITLQDIDDVELTIELGAASTGPNPQCDVGVKLLRATNVRLVQTVVKGCKVGIDIEDSTGVTINGGKVENYGEGGVGVLIAGSDVVEVSNIELRSHPGGGGVSTTAKGVVIGGGSKAVTVRPNALRANAVGVEIGAAEGVVVQGRIGLPPIGETVSTGAGNEIGVDVVGPAKDVVIGGRPYFAHALTGANWASVTVPIATIVANNGHTSAAHGAGIRVAQVDGLRVVDAYIGVTAADGTTSNRVGMRVTGPAARRVRVERCHIGNNGDAGVVFSAVTAASVSGSLFAGAPTAGWNPNQPPFPVTDPGFAGERCTPVTAVTTFQPDALPAFSPSRSAVAGLLVGDGSRGVTVAGSAFVGEQLAVVDADDVSLTGLSVWGATAAGIRVEHSAGVRLRDVATWQHGGAGLLLDGSGGVAFEGCAAANAGAGLEVTGVPVGAAGENAVGRATNLSGETVIVTPAGAVWEHQPPKLERARADAVFVGNGGDGVSVHDGAVGLLLAQAIAIDNAGYGLAVREHDGPVTLEASSVGLHALAAGGGGAAVAATAHPNEQGGVYVADAMGAVVIGGEPTRGNVISGNGVAGRPGHGVTVLGSERVMVSGNFVGLDPAGAVAMGNRGDGVHAISASRLSVTAQRPRAANVIAGNGGHGIYVAATDTHGRTRVAGNYVGVDATGMDAVPNAGDGVHVALCLPDDQAVDVWVNLVSGNGGAGIAADRCAGGQLDVRSNDVGGSNRIQQGLPNLGPGVALVATSGARVRGNRIDAKLPNTHGIGISLDGSSDNEIESNSVTEAGDAGVLIVGSRRNRFAGNVVREGGGAGVVVGLGATQNRLTANAITANAGDGIVLVADGNQGIAAPHIGSAFEASSGAWTFAGAATAPQGSVIEVFADEDREGRVPLPGATAYVTQGAWAVRGYLPPLPLAGLTLCATVTDPLGNTSAFGCDPVPAGGATCALGAEPPGDDAYALRVITSADGYAATELGTGASEALPMLVPIGGEAAVCGSLVAFSGGAGARRDIYLHDLGAGTTTQLTDEPGVDTEPAFTRDCATLAFASDRSGAFDIYTMALDGSGVTAVTADADEDRSPTFGGLGASTVAWSRKPVDAEGFGIFVSYGGAPVALVDGEGDERDPAWHPADSRVAFTRCFGAVCQLAVVDAEVGIPHHIGAPACEDRGPAWVVGAGADGEDSEHLLVARRPVAAVGAAPGPFHVVLLSPEGNPLWRVTPAARSDEAPACCAP